MNTKFIYEYIIGNNNTLKYKVFKRKFDAILQGEFDTVYYERLRLCYHKPRKFEQILDNLDTICNTYGVECIEPDESKNGYRIYYLNVGDSYIPTIVYCGGWTHKFKIAYSGYVQYVK